MFTGIIEEMGTIQDIQRETDRFSMAIGAKEILKDVRTGDSISVNGVCLTVTSFTESNFTVDIMPETVNATNLKDLEDGAPVNLERSMAAGGRFGGHFVSGHVDGTGEIIERTPEKNAMYFRIKVPKELTRHMILKGSVAVDGTSLTVFGVTEDTFTISLIPHTMKETVFGTKKPGDLVNIECDMVGKYIDKLANQREEGITHV